MKMEPSDVNKTSVGDVTLAVVRAGISTIPIAGAMVDELLNVIIAPPLEKRRRAWMIEIGERLQKLESERGINLEELRESPIFIDTVLQATSYSLKTSEREKIDAFKNAISNVAVDLDIDKAKSQIFLNLLDSFTIWHVKILNYIDDPIEWYKKARMTPPENYMSSFSRTFSEIFPELRNNDELIDLIWSDLRNAGFHRSSDVKTTMSGGGVLQKTTTNLGHEFLNFITFSET